MNFTSTSGTIPSYIQRNEKWARAFLEKIIKEAIVYLRIIYIQANAKSFFKKIRSALYFDFFLKRYLGKLLKNQIRIISETAADIATKVEDPLDLSPNQVDIVDKIVDNHYIEYRMNDMTVLHVSDNHSIRLELEHISRLTLRLSALQVTRLLANKTPEISGFADLALYAYPDYNEAKNVVQAVTSIMDQMMDAYERNLDAIAIPFYRPTWNLRNFQYLRHVYEFVTDRMDEEVKKFYSRHDRSGEQSPIGKDGGNSQ